MVLKFTRRISLLILLGFLFCTIGAGLKPAHVAVQPKEPPRAMWVWDVKIFQDKEASNRLFNFCKTYNINLLFYTAYKVTGQTVEKDYKRFNSQAHKRGILVHALAGDPRWAIEKYHHRFLEWTNNVLDFNKSASADERFDGIHADVEPYILGKVWEQSHKSLLIQYLDVCEKVKEVIKRNGSPIVFAVDVPFWYDDDTTMWVEWHKKMSPANYHALDIADQIIIMDYRNFADGDNGSVLLAKNEINYAGTIGKKAYIGQETGRKLEPDYITFGGTNADYMEKQLGKIVKAYAGNPGFAGIAIHHYISYKRLLRESGKVVE
jgi:hypothetical protein